MMDDPPTDQRPGLDVLLGYASACVGDGELAYHVPLMYGAHRAYMRDDRREYGPLMLVHPETAALVPNSSPTEGRIARLGDVDLTPRAGSMLGVFDAQLLPYSPILSLAALQWSAGTIARRLWHDEASAPPSRVVLYAPRPYLRRLCELVAEDIRSAVSIATTREELARYQRWVAELLDGTAEALSPAHGGENEHGYRAAPPTADEVRAASLLRATPAAEESAVFERFDTATGGMRRVTLQARGRDVYDRDANSLHPLTAASDTTLWRPTLGSQSVTWSLLHDTRKTRS